VPVYRGGVFEFVVLAAGWLLCGVMVAALVGSISGEVSEMVSMVLLAGSVVALVLVLAVLAT
jgi:hypothetical protein